MFMINLRHFISNASILLSSSFLSVQLSQPYIATGHTSALHNFIFVVVVMSWLFHIFLRSVATAYPFANLIRISAPQSLSSLIVEPKYVNLIIQATVTLYFFAVNFI